MALDVQALADFNNETAGELMTKLVYEGQTMSFITINEGVKHTQPINLFEVDAAIQDGTCVSTESGSASFTQRNITVAPRTSHDGLCLKTLDKKSLGIVGLEKGSYNETFAMAQAYGEALVNSFSKKDDQYLWNTTDGLGYYTDSANESDVIVPAGAAAITTTNAVAQIDAMIAELSEDVQDRDDLTVFMSPANFKKYVIGLRKENNFAFDRESISQENGISSLKHPFFNVTVVGTVGLKGSERVVLTPAKYIVAGVDSLADTTEFQMWYDINSDKLKHRIATKLGVQVAYPEYIVSNDLA